MDEIRGKQLLIIDDESQMCYLLKLIFGSAGAEVYTATNGMDGLNILNEFHPHLVLLDIMMPGIDGLETCRRIRQSSSVPVIMLTVLSREQDIIRGLRAGADDYVTKPFDRQLLLSRVIATLRRATQDAHNLNLTRYHDGYLTIDPGDKRVCVRGKPVILSHTELTLLAYLYRNAGNACTYNQIFKNVWGEGDDQNSDYVHSYIWRLRRKLEQDPTSPHYLISRNVDGYQFVIHPDQQPI